MKGDCADELEQRLLEKGTHDESLPLPGQLVNADFRDANASAHAWAAIAAGRPVRVVQWNIERGLEFDAILSTLKQLQADVLLIQEIDNGCDRTDGRDVGVLSGLKTLPTSCLRCQNLAVQLGIQWPVTQFGALCYWSRGHLWGDSPVSHKARGRASATPGSDATMS